jgi:hypothetical protein
MKGIWVIVFFALALLSGSCTIEKRHYRNGFYINWNNDHPHSASIVERDSVPVISHLAVTVETDSTQSENSEVISETFNVEPTERSNTHCATDHENLKDPESSSAEVGKNDEPQPETHDKLNPLVSPLVALGVLLGIAGVLCMYLVSNPALLILVPIVGLLCLTAAYLLRKRFTLKIAAGDRNKRYRISAHFHRAKIVLFIFFAAEALFSLGWFLGVVGSSIGFIGFLMLTSGIVIMTAVSVVLLALLLIYLFQWRKDPTGYRKPRDRHPPKDH